MAIMIDRSVDLVMTVITCAATLLTKTEASSSALSISARLAGGIG